MKKTLLLFIAMFAAMITISAETKEVTFDFAGNPWGYPLGSGNGETAAAGNVENITQDNVVMSFVQGDASTPARMWTGPQLRVYKNSTITITAPAGYTITNVVWTATGTKYYGFTVDGTEVAAEGWTGDAAAVNFVPTVNGRYTKAVVTLWDGEGEGEGGGNEGGNEGGDQGGDDNDEPTAATLWSEPFATGMGDFTLEDKTLPEGSSYVWAHSTYYDDAYMKASAYVSGACHAAESWLISPVFDFSKATSLSLSIEQAANKFNSQENFLAACKVVVKEKDATHWSELTFDVYPAGTTWDFVVSTADLAAYVGKTVQIALVYTSTAEVAGTWEVCNFTLKGEGEVSIVAKEEPVVVVDGLAALKAEAVGKHTVKLTDAIITYINGNNFYVQDANAGINGYVSGHTFAASQKINGEVVVTTSLYGGAVQIAAIELGGATVVEGAEVPCTEVTVAELLANGEKYTNMRVKVTNATLTAPFESRNGEIEQNGSTVAIYQKDKNAVFEVEANSTVNVVGYPGFYNGTLQLNVWEAADITAVTPEGISNITINNNAAIYSVDGRRLAQPVKGINIINGKKVYVK